VTVASINAMFAATLAPAVTLYVGNDNPTCQAGRLDLTGPRMFNGSYGPLSRFTPEEVRQLDGWCDSGAFNDPPHKRLTAEGALERQLRWEAKASEKWGEPYTHRAVISYDLLIDEKWVNGEKFKERWNVGEADQAVRVTVDAAAYLASQRERLAPRRLVLASQGVDASQYVECASGVLQHCMPGDIFGLGGWCILGLQRRWLPTFWDAMRRVLPMVRAAGLTRVHIFGVMWPKALGGLVWLADRERLTVSTDSKKAISDCTYKSEANAKRAGRKCPLWRDNVKWWKDTLAGLRRSPFYREPPLTRTSRQGSLFDLEAA
jgi:hypothetical protein